MEHNAQPSKASTSRRSFLRKGLTVGGTGAIGAGLLASGVSLSAFAEAGSSSITPGDVAILRFLATAEILETDLWQQYNELGGIQDSEVPGGSGNPAYTKALAVLDLDMAQYIHDNACLLRGFCPSRCFPVGSDSDPFYDGLAGDSNGLPKNIHKYRTFSFTTAATDCFTAFSRTAGD